MLLINTVNGILENYRLSGDTDYLRKAIATIKAEVKANEEKEAKVNQNVK